MNIDLIVAASGRSREWALGFTFASEKEALEAVKRHADALQYVDFSK